MLERAVVDLFRLPQLELPQPGQLPQRRDSLGRDRGLAQIQPLQPAQLRQPRQTEIGDLGGVQAQLFELGQRLERFDVKVRQRQPPQARIRAL